MSSIQDKLIPVNLEKEMKRSFISYAMAVIIDRALPDRSEEHTSELQSH